MSSLVRSSFTDNPSTPTPPRTLGDILQPTPDLQRGVGGARDQLGPCPPRPQLRSQLRDPARPRDRLRHDVPGRPVLWESCRRQLSCPPATKPGVPGNGTHCHDNVYLQDCGHIHGMFLLSPVDGADPYGLIEETCISPPTKLNFQLPVLIISGGLDSQPGLGGGLGGLWPACAPEDLANARSVFWPPAVKTIRDNWSFTGFTMP